MPQPVSALNFNAEIAETHLGEEGEPDIHCLHMRLIKASNYVE